MPELDEVRRREKRVAAVFVLMLGAGLVLDAGLLVGGGLLMVLGVALFWLGMSGNRAQSVTESEAGAVAAPRMDQ